MHKITQIAKKQKGIALLIVTVAISLFVLALAFKHLNARNIELIKKEKTAKALFEAKTTLLGWSVLQNKPGLMPCPEDTSMIGTLNEGSALPTCNFAVGRLPWRTLGLEELLDGNGDRLWYAVSNDFGDNSIPINNSTVGQIVVNGNPNVVAVIFSSGVALTGQARPNPTNLAPPVLSNYLDTSNNDGDANFINNGLAGTFNDNLLTITHAELFDLVANRILREVRGDNAQGLVGFVNANGSYPFADIDNDGISDGANIGTPTYQNTATNSTEIFFAGPTFNMLFTDNNWLSQITYQLNSPTSVTMTLNGQSLMVP
jgi:hypothetical protein